MRSSTPFGMHSQQATAPAQQTVEGMWWKEEKDVTGFVALANVTSQPVQATVQVSDNQANSLAQHTVTISPHGMKLVNLTELPSALGTEGGINITYTGLPDSLVINGGVQDEAVGYSAGLAFASSPLQPSQLPSNMKLTEFNSIAELGLMAGAADPMMNFPAGTTFTPFSVLRNISNAPISLTPTIWWMQAGQAHSAQLQPVQLQPYQSQSLNLTQMLALSGIPNYNGSFNIVFNGSLKRGALLTAAGSVDQTKNYVFQIVPGGVAESASKSIQYWSTNNGDDTMITLWNPTDESQDLILTLYFTGGHYLVPIHLDPRATRMINLSEIVQSAPPDSEGNTIPPTVHDGSAKITGNLADNQNILIAMDAGIYNVRKATCGWVCYTCNGWVDGTNSVTPNPFAVTVDGGVQMDFTDQWNDGSTHYLTDVATWSGGNVSISDSGYLTGLTGGQTGIEAQDSSEPVYATPCSGNGDPCPVAYGVGGGASGTVDDSTPLVTGITPSDWQAGTTQSVTFSGQYFGTNAPTLSFSPSSGITYSLQPGYNDTQIVANVTVASGTPNETVSVSVTNNGYGSSGFIGASGTPATSSPAQANVHAPLNAPEITVIAWINPNAPDLVSLPCCGNQQLVTALNSSPGSCAGVVFYWSVFPKQPLYISSQGDKDYANAWLMANSANTAPPPTIDPSAQYSGGNYRLFNDFGNGKGAYNLGITPDPCKTGIVPGWAAKGQPSQYTGPGTSASGMPFQLVEGRIGSVGQAGSYTINGRTVPWVWSVIEFDSSGNPTYSDHAMFPTYSVYNNGSLVATYPQSSTASFAANDQTYQRTPSQIP